MMVLGKGNLLHGQSCRAHPHGLGRLCSVLRRISAAFKQKAQGAAVLMS